MGSASRLYWNIWCIFAFLLYRNAFSGVAAALSNITDASALLAFKALSTADPSNALTRWNISLNVCSWGRVSCTSSGRVKSISLISLRLAGTLPVELGDLSELQALELDKNSLSGPIPSTLSKLTKLVNLTASANYLSGTIPPSIFLLPKLRALDLNSNQLSGSIPEEVGQYNGSLLDLSNNALSGELPAELGNMANMAILDLSHNSFSGSLPTSLTLLNETLVTLAIANASLTGTIPTEFEGLFAGVKWDYVPPGYSEFIPCHLDLSYNKLSGIIPTEIGKLGSLLETLDLSYNRLTGSIPSSMSKLTGLVNLFLQENQLTGDIPDIFSKMTYLQGLDLSSNFLSGSIPPSVFTVGGTADGYPCSLRQLVLRQNLLRGTVPEGMENCDNLVQVSVQSNRFSGPFPNINSQELEILELGVNRFFGPIPQDLKDKFPALQTLDIAANLFNGTVPSSIFSIKNLTVVDLSRNQFNQPLKGPSSSSSASDLAPLVILDISRNSIPGPLPSTLAKLNLTLSSLKLSHNQISGPLPEEFSKLGQLQYFDAPFNQINGSLPQDLSGLVSLRFLDLTENTISGQLPDSIGLMTALLSLNLSQNSFNSSIPETIGNLTRLQQLNLSGNLLSGNIPSSLGKLPTLSLLDLSRNFFAGDIPGTLSSLSGLQSLNLSDNHLSGAIPGGNLSKFGNNSFINNEDLCGDPVGVKCPSPPSSGLSTLHIILIAVGSFIAFLLVCCVVSALMLTRLNGWEDGEFFLFQKVGAPLTMKIILEATENFSPKNILGQGGFGAVYKVTLKDGTELAVKRLFEGAGQGLLEVKTEMRTLGRVKHKNLVTLVGAFIGRKEALLIYEFLPGGDLEKKIFESDEIKRDKFASWSVRLKSLLDSARGIKYLHHDAPSTIIHRDIKPPNILFDSELTAKVADFGLAKEIDLKEQTHLSTAVSGTIGYLAPEYATSGKLTAKTDVFAFGVVILQALTGKRPGEESLGDYGLAKWVHKTWKDKSLEAVLDPILRYDPTTEETQVIGTLRLGLMCSSKSPENRPTMDEVVYLLENLDIFEDDSRSVASLETSSLGSQEVSRAGMLPPINRGPRPAFLNGGDSSSGVSLPSLQSISTDHSSFTMSSVSIGPLQPSNKPL